MSDNSLPKQLSALNGQLIGQVYLDKGVDGQHWCCDVLIIRNDDYDNKDGRRESLIDGRRYVVVFSEEGFKTRSIAMQHCILGLADMVSQVRLLLSPRINSTN